MVVETEAARLLVWRAGDLKNKGKPNTRETSIAKLYASETAQRGHRQRHTDPRWIWLLG